MFFWVWVLNILTFVLPILLDAKPIKVFEGLVRLPLLLVVSDLSTRTLLSNSIDAILGNGLLILCTIPFAWLLLKLTKERDFTNYLSPSIWYVLSIIANVLNHTYNIKNALLIGPALAWILLLNYILAAITLSLIYKKYNIKKAIFVHICWNSISSGIILFHLFW